MPLSELPMASLLASATPGPFSAAKYPDCKTWTVFSSTGGTVASRLTESNAVLIARLLNFAHASGGEAIRSIISRIDPRPFGAVLNDEGQGIVKGSQAHVELCELVKILDGKRT